MHRIQLGLPGVAIAACLTLAVACSEKPQVSNTGYTGVWERGSETLRSSFGIVRQGEQHLFRWWLSSPNEEWKVDCDWQGRCDEFMQGAKTATFEFATRTDPATGHLMVDVKRHILLPEPSEDSWTDELVLEPDGLTLWTYTVVRRGEALPEKGRPAREFTKVADQVPDAPPATP